MLVTTKTKNDAILMAKLLIKNGIHFTAKKISRNKWDFDFEPSNTLEIIEKIYKTMDSKKN